MRGRGGFANRGRGGKVATAIHRSAFVGISLTNSARRIQKDLKELQDNKLNIPGVSAEPLNDSIYQWRGNLVGPPGTKWDGGVFHFEMTLPSNYPMSPPTVRLLTSITHPNVIGGTSVCLDMLGSQKKIYQGWVPAYTVEAVLMQLQSFLFEDEIKKSSDTMSKKELAQIKQDIQRAKDFKCPITGHMGMIEHKPPTTPFPKWAKSVDPNDEKKVSFNLEEDQSSFVVVQSPKDLYLNELLCFITKTPLREATLGVGISLKKSVRTAEVKFVNPTMDLINMRAFQKHKIRSALEGEKFTHWLPLYFGEDEEYTVETQKIDRNAADPEPVTVVQTVNVKERFERHFFNSMAFIANGNIKKPLTAQNVLDIFPRLIMTHVVDLCKMNRHTSITAIRRLFNFLRLFFLCIKKFPEVSEKMDAKLKEFIEDPARRLKDPDVCPNLGDLLVYSIMSQTYNFEDIKLAYADEQLDRQVIWMLQKIPELDFENKRIKNKGKTSEEKRKSVCFEISKVGCQITTFFFRLNEIIQEKTGLLAEGRWDLLAKSLDQNHGCLDTDLENKLQIQLKAAIGLNTRYAQTTQQQLKSYEDYYKILKIEIEEGSAGIYAKLIQAVKNSRSKGYHDDELDFGARVKLPPIPDQSQRKVLNILSQFTEFTEDSIQPLQIEEINVQTSTLSSTTSLGQAEPYKYENKRKIKEMRLKSDVSTESHWKALCAENFPFVKRELSSNKDKFINAAKLAQMHDDMELYKYQDFDNRRNLESDDLKIQRRTLLNQDVEFQYQNYTTIKDYNEETFLYRQLMLKLTFEELVKDVSLNYDFGIIHEFLNVFVNDLETVKINMIDTTHLKSNNYYLLGIIPKLSRAKIIKFYKDYDAPATGKNAINFLKKALTYFNKNFGSLTKFEFGHGIEPTSEDFLFGYLKQMPELIVLKMNNYPLQLKDAKAIGKYLSDHLSVRELDLTSTSLQTNCAREIADGLMRAKNLEIVKMRDNQSFDCSQVLYNLAFSPKINHIDLSRSCTQSAASTWRQIVEAMFKLLKISGSIQSLLFGETQVANHLTEDFNKALGESVSIQYVNFDAPKTQTTRSPLIETFFKAIAMNAYKNGQLRTVSIKRCTSATNLDYLLQQFWVSDKSHELWYGDANEANKMQKEQLEMKLHCALTDLDIGFSKAIMLPPYKLKELQKQKKPNWPWIVKFFAEKGFRTLQMNNCAMNFNDAGLWSTTLGENPIGQCKLKVLNFSSTDIGIHRIKLLASALEHNTSIEFLDLSNNRLQVFGTYLLCKSLQKNNTLKGLNLFKNSIDVDGCRHLRDLLKVNQTLEFLDIGHNRIRAKGLEAISEGMNSTDSCKIKTLGLRMNFLNDDSIQQFMNDVIFSNMSKLERVYIKFNNITQGKIIDLKNKLSQQNSLLYIDEFEKVVHLTDEERKKKTLYFKISTITGGSMKMMIRQFRQFCPQVGIVRNSYFRKGHPIKKKPFPHNYFFVEFENEESVQKCMKYLQKTNPIGATPYLVGTNTYVQIRKSVKK